MKSFSIRQNATYSETIPILRKCNLLVMTGIKFWHSHRYCVVDTTRRSWSFSRQSRHSRSIVWCACVTGAESWIQATGYCIASILDANRKNAAQQHSRCSMLLSCEDVSRTLGCYVYLYTYYENKIKKKIVIILPRPAKKCSAAVFQSYHLVQTIFSLSHESICFSFFIHAHCWESVLLWIDDQTVFEACWLKLPYPGLLCTYMVKNKKKVLEKKIIVVF